MDAEDPFARLADEARAGEARRERVEAAWLRQRATEDATVAGTLVDLAEQARPVAVRSASGRTYRGVVTAVGADFAVVRTGSAGDAWVRAEAIVAVRPEQGLRAREASGARPAPVTTRLVEALAVEAEQRPRVVLVPASGGDAIAGTLRSVGTDVVTVEPDGDRSPWFVRLASIAEVIVRG